MHVKNWSVLQSFLEVDVCMGSKSNESYLSEVHPSLLNSGMVVASDLNRREGKEKKKERKKATRSEGQKCENEAAERILIKY